MPHRGAGDKAVGPEAAIHGGGMEEKPMGEASAKRIGEGGRPGGSGEAWKGVEKGPIWSVAPTLLISIP